MKYLSIIFTACAGLVITMPTIPTQECTCAQSDFEKALQDLCDAKFGPTNRAFCEIDRKTCEDHGKKEHDQLLNCIKVIRAYCENDNDCGDKF